MGSPDYIAPGETAYYAHIGYASGKPEPHLTRITIDNVFMDGGGKTYYNNQVRAGSYGYPADHVHRTRDIAEAWLRAEMTRIHIAFDRAVDNASVSV